MSTINLKQAIDATDIEQVKMAIESGVDLNKPLDDTFQLLPLLHACKVYRWEKSSQTLIQLLLDGGADISATDKHGRNAMNIAACFGKGYIVAILKRNSQTICTSCSLLELTSSRPRHFCMPGQREGYKKVFSLLLEEEPNLEEKTDDKYKKTALHLACGNGFWEEIEMLIGAGADPNCKDATGDSPLAYLINFAWRARIECLIPIHMLVKVGADINNLGDSPEFDTALGWATKFGGNTLTVVTLLLESGADPNKANHEGETPLIHAAGSDRPDLIQVLLFFGANLDHRDNKGKTAMDHANANNRSKAINVLKKNKEPN